MYDKEYEVTKYLPINNQVVLAYGYRTYCCEEDKDDDMAWHRVVFSLRICSYKLKKEIPADLNETILESCEVSEFWKCEDEEDNHLIGVTKWKVLHS